MSRTTHTAFGALQQIDAGALNVGYAEAGPSDGPAAVLLHGWPYAFTGRKEHRDLTGGLEHNLPQEAPRDFAQAIVDVDGF